MNNKTSGFIRRPPLHPCSPAAFDEGEKQSQDKIVRLLLLRLLTVGSRFAIEELIATCQK